MAWTLVSKDVVAALHHVDPSVLQDEWSEWAEGLIEDYTGYRYIGTTATISDEPHSGDGTGVLFVRYPPIVSVTSIKVGSSVPTTLSTNSYKVFDKYIQLVDDPTSELSLAIGYRPNSFPKGVQNIAITYVSGLSSVPARIQFTAAEMIVEISKFYQRGGADSSMRFNKTTQIKSQEQGVAAQKGLSATLLSIMRLNLRKRVVPLA